MKILNLEKNSKQTKTHKMPNKLILFNILLWNPIKVEKHKNVGIITSNLSQKKS